MGYVAIKGGEAAIQESIEGLKYERLKNKEILETAHIQAGLRGLIDQIMSESSLYSEELASIAIKQTEGNAEEAVLLLRAYRSTLPRKHYTRLVNTGDMLVERRISAGFKDIPGGQLLGSAYDYTHRLIDFSLIEETKAEAIQWLETYEARIREGSSPIAELPKVVQYLRKEGLLREHPEDSREPKDITKQSMEFPTERSERLQALTRGMSSAVIALGYAAIRGYSQLHPTVGELRIGSLPLYVSNPLSLQEASAEEDFYIGEIRATEVESLIPILKESQGDRKEIEFEIGYGSCFGQNETKAIAMSILDQCLERPCKEFPTHNEEFVLLHIDAVEASGFISHLKLPHYVTFQSELDRVRRSRSGGNENEDSL